MTRTLAVFSLVGLLAAGCSGGGTNAPVPDAAGAAQGGQPAQPATTLPEPPEDELPSVASPYDAFPEAARVLVDKPFTGDLDEMIKRRIIRAGVTFNRTHYFIDKGEQRGMAYESLRSFEEELNKVLKTGNLKVHVAFVPLPRDQLLPALTDGRVDLVAAQLTITPERQRLVDFTDPVRANVREVIVTGPGSPALGSLDDLSGKTVFVRRSSSYHESLVALNAQLASRGRPPVVIEPAPESLEDDDVLEMVNAGLVPITIVDDYLTEFWSQVFTGLSVHKDLAVRTGGVIAVAVRPGNTGLKAAANAWIKKYGQKTAFSNVMNKRYLGDTKFARNATSESERRKFLELVELFRKYSDQYELDFLLMAAQGYQESRLDQSVKSPVGAIGVMQVMPATGAELKVGDITQLEPNIHAGVKYVRTLMNQQFNDPSIDPLNKGLFAFAAYNAGPGRVRQLRREAEKRGLDPNVWFGSVERIASERVGRETVQYVSNIFKYYVAYTLVKQQMDARDALKRQARP
jgi:membrane-bound lytic murein transglycosylase MltF